MGNRTYNTSRRSVCMSDDTYEAICAAAKEKRMSPAALIRRYIEDGLKIGWMESAEDSVRKIVHEELDNVLNVRVERLIKLQLKSTRASAATLYSIIYFLSRELYGDGSIEELLTKAFKMAAKYTVGKNASDDEYAAEAKECISSAAAFEYEGDI